MQPVDFLEGSNFEGAFVGLQNSFAILQSSVVGIDSRISQLESGLAQVQNNSLILFFGLVVCVSLLTVIAVRSFR